MGLCRSHLQHDHKYNDINVVLVEFCGEDESVIVVVVVVNHSHLIPIVVVDVHVVDVTIIVDSHNGDENDA